MSIPPQLDANGQPVVVAPQFDASGQPLAVQTARIDANGLPLPDGAQLDANGMPFVPRLDANGQPLPAGAQLQFNRLNEASRVMNNFTQAETQAIETSAVGSAALVEAAGTASTIPQRANRTTYVPITSSVWDQQDKSTTTP